MLTPRCFSAVYFWSLNFTCFKPEALKCFFFCIFESCNCHQPKPINRSSILLIGKITHHFSWKWRAARVAAYIFFVRLYRSWWMENEVETRLTTHAAVNKHRNRIQTKLTKISRKERNDEITWLFVIRFESFELNLKLFEKKNTFLQVSMISSTTAPELRQLPSLERKFFASSALRSLVCLCVALPVDDDNERGDLWLWRWDFTTSIYPQ